LRLRVILAVAVVAVLLPWARMERLPTEVTAGLGQHRLLLALLLPMPVVVALEFLVTVQTGQGALVAAAMGGKLRYHQLLARPIWVVAVVEAAQQLEQQMLQAAQAAPA
jgi:hypothetical protein